MIHTKDIVAEDNVVIHVGGRTKISPYKIAYLEACGNYTIVHLADSQKKFLVATTLGILEERLASISHLFIRPQRGYLINVLFVKNFDKENIILHNSLQIEVPRRKKAKIYTKLQYLLNLPLQVHW